MFSKIGHMPLELQRFDVLFVSSMLPFSHLPLFDSQKEPFSKADVRVMQPEHSDVRRKESKFYKIGPDVHYQKSDIVTVHHCLANYRLAQERYANKLGTPKW